MKTIVAAMLVALALPALGAGRSKPKKQREPNPKEMSRRMVEGLERELSLSPEQAKKVAAVVEESMAEGQALRKKLMEHERKVNESIRAVLDDEQKEKFDMMRAHRMMAMGQGGQKRAPKPEDEDRPGVMIDSGDEPEAPPPPRKK